ncbi:DUF2975 domain-containing protein [uncultured Flavobacterium sp.]|uniref:DUF2975 domain-containing protein n=1 Tax=uncultured Flavobacterium sp. TaxID=165435 RepID=UPI0030CA50D7
MRKLNFLKAIIDFICIINYLTVPILVMFLGFVVISSEPLGVPITINGIEVNVISIQTKVLLIFMTFAALLIVYCLFLFRNILRLFQRVKIFDLEVIKSFHVIGVLLLISAFLAGVPSFVIRVLKKEVNLEIGVNPFVILFCLGLFFMVLSEVFIIAKKQKEENELTI